LNTAATAKRRVSRSRQIRWASLAIALLMTGLALAFLRFETVEFRELQQANVELRASVLEDHTARIIESVDVIQRSLANIIAREDAQAGGESVDALLFNSLRGRPFLRSLSLVGADGTVRASSNPTNVGVKVPEAWRAAVATDLSTRLAPLASGRDLADLDQIPVSQARLLTLPILKPVDASAGETLVALVNLDHFATQFDRLLSIANEPDPERGMRALLIGLDGQLLVGSSTVTLPAGTSMLGLPMFTQFLPRLESGSWIGTGSDGETFLSAFRVTRQWPLVVLVEQRHTFLPAPLRHMAAWTAGILLTSLALLALASLLAERAMRRDARLNRNQRTAHEETKASELRKLAILQSSLDAIVTVGADGRVIEFNVAAERIFGHKAATVIGRPMHEIIVPAHHREAHQAGMARYRKTQVAHVLNRRIEIEALRADGSLFPVELTIVPVQTADGEIFTATLRDITERLRVEQALRDSEARANATFDQAAVGVLQQAFDGRLLRVNQKLCVLLGYTSEELLALRAKDIVHPDDFAAVHQRVQELLEGKSDNFSSDRRYRRRDGNWLWARITLSLARDAQEQPLYLIGIVEDITARHHAQNELAQARERELTIGSRIQQALLVDAPDQRLPGLWLATLNQASQGIDGDFVELIELGDNGVDIIVGDVMGKGVAAALMAAATKMQFSRCVAELLASPTKQGQLPTPAEVVATVHRAMTLSLQALDAFVALSYVRLDTRAGTVTWVGCGNEEPLLLRANGEVVALPNQHTPMGVLNETEFHQTTLPFHQGDAIFLSSDGAADALMPDGSRLGRERVLQRLSSVLEDVWTPAAALHVLRQELLDSGARITDDLTLALATSSGETTQASRRELLRGLNDLPHVRGLVEARCREAGLDDVDASLFTVACVEAYSNAVRHTVNRPKDAPIELVVRILRDQIAVDIVTLGKAFSPAPELVDTDFAAFPEGGFGLHIMTQATQSLEHLHARGVNTVRLTRQLTAV
jgi:phosphoserine phosphatase RsbU/P